MSGFVSQVHSKEGKVSSSLGVSVSVMANTEVAIDDELKTIFDWCKEGNTKQVAKLLEQNKEMVDSKDSEVWILLFRFRQHFRILEFVWKKQ
ncbi:hypothetical protein DPMN_150050 [Dreissena polymorpha]|uniref:Uncharacterized protein n=1 Tax=Dreissena polymorpha TaxID=45954 RepID=A0A9D4FDW0_DREPO|nr:hypothetical protein DPMN_150050 [Dreissena polymorpha]